MGKKQRTIVLDKDLARELLTLAGEADFSRFVNDMLRFHLQRQRIEGLEEIFAREYGPLTPETKAWADAIEWPR